ncbi:HIRAN domain-containing protein [Exiguobacterium mexicanum]|uniref:HIRAN domain-containing protein n=1 Tax=Exiguobacterium mexicanum TaxID=340146 RepID=UPI00110EFA63|nr:HIRAN domain-containing protein [Exiguobacterium mexicanum]
MLEFIVVAVLVILFLEDRRKKKRLNQAKAVNTKSLSDNTTRTNRDEKYNKNTTPVLHDKKEPQTPTLKVHKRKVNRIIRLAGVTFEGRQKLIAETKISENIKLKREPRNPHDKNAINVYDSKNRSLGWIPRETAKELAPLMDRRISLKAEIIQKTGVSYPRGLEIRVYSL